jgi:arylsulfatase A-like enzyme
MLPSMDGKPGQGTHGSLSPFDLHNTLIAAGPDFKKGFVSTAPSGNIDVAPTILSILGVDPQVPMDGRVLAEAMADPQTEPLKPVEKKLQAQRDLGFISWNQYLKVTYMGNTAYYDEGNGEVRLK